MRLYQRRTKQHAAMSAKYWIGIFQLDTEKSNDLLRGGNSARSIHAFNHNSASSNNTSKWIISNKNASTSRTATPYKYAGIRGAIPRSGYCEIRPNLWGGRKRTRSVLVRIKKGLLGFFAIPHRKSSRQQNAFSPTFSRPRCDPASRYPPRQLVRFLWDVTAVPNSCIRNDEGRIKSWGEPDSCSVMWCDRKQKRIPPFKRKHDNLGSLGVFLISELIFEANNLPFSTHS